MKLETLERKIDETIHRIDMITPLSKEQKQEIKKWFTIKFMDRDFSITEKVTISPLKDIDKLESI
jgi:hypothetical protein